MGLFFRKSLRLLPGLRVTLSKSGPRLGFGVPGVRASVDLHGKARLSGGAGPIRYQKSIALGSVREGSASSGLLSWVRKIFTVP
jgi:hypothetical protein